MGLAAAISAGASVLGAGVQAYGANQAAKTQANAAKAGQQTQWNMYNQTRSDLAPFLSTGTSALEQLAGYFGIGSGGPNGGTAASAMSALQNYPGYQFQFNQGLQGLDRSAASRGLELSGAQLKDATTFGQGQAQNAWGSYLAQLSGLAGLGENAGAQTGSFGQNTANQVSQLQLAQGQAGAAGQVGVANSFQSALQNSLLGYQLYGGGGGGFSPPFNTGDPSVAAQTNF